MTATGWNFADIWEAVADRFPGEPALEHAGEIRSWRSFEQRAHGLASTFLAAGLGRQAKVAQYLYNGPEYLESVFASFKGGLVPVNTNYRYVGEELANLWRDADVEAVVFHGVFTDRCAELRDAFPRICCWVHVDDGSVPCPEWAVPYGEAASISNARLGSPWPRSGDDLMLQYTGGTTGAPKGVMWPQDTLHRMLEELNGRQPGMLAAPVAHAAALERPGPRVLPAAPLMHSTAIHFSMPALSRGGCIVTSPDRRFDAASLLDLLSSSRATGICIVGDAFARPIVRALDDEPERWDLARLRVLSSSGVLLSREAKAGLLRHAPHLTIIDVLGSSESGGFGRSQTTSGDEPTGARFRVDSSTRVVDDDGRDVMPGSGARGRLAVTGHIPVGYYNNPEKTASTFVQLDGQRYVIAGDWAEVEADGTVRLVGRGSVCVNTGGEKVYPEEVEQVVKSLPPVFDAVVVGVPTTASARR